MIEDVLSEREIKYCVEGWGDVVDDVFWWFVKNGKIW